MPSFILVLPFIVRLLFSAAPAATNSVTLKPGRDTVRLLVTGDTGGTHSRLIAGMLAVHRRTPIDAIVLVGDNFYPCGVSSVDDPEWTKVTKHFGWVHVPIFPVLGNHDYGDPGAGGMKSPPCRNTTVDPEAEVRASGRIPQWTFPARSYVVRTKPADLVMCDTEPIALGWQSPVMNSGTSNDIVQWVGHELDASRARWRIVVGHHAIYSSGPHGTGTSSDARLMRRSLLPVLAAGHADVYMCGHDHEMELIGNLSKGPLFLISGAGSDLYQTGRRTNPAEPPTVWPPEPGQQFYGFAIVEISMTRLAITFYDEHGTRRSTPFVVTK